MWELLFLCLFAVSRDFAQACFHSHFIPLIIDSAHNMLLVILIPDDKSPAESEVNVEMQRCGAYEVVQLSLQRVTMKDNPAYVDVSVRTLH